MGVEVHFGVKNWGVIPFIGQSLILLAVLKLKGYSDIVEKFLIQVPFHGLSNTNNNMPS